MNNEDYILSLLQDVEKDLLSSEVEKDSETRKKIVQNLHTLEDLVANMTEEEKKDLRVTDLKNEIINEYFPNGFKPEKLEEIMNQLKEMIIVAKRSADAKKAENVEELKYKTTLEEYNKKLEEYKEKLEKYKNEENISLESIENEYNSIKSEYDKIMNTNWNIDINGIGHPIEPEKPTPKAKKDDDSINTFNDRLEKYNKALEEYRKGIYKEYQEATEKLEYKKIAEKCLDVRNTLNKEYEKLTKNIEEYKALYNEERDKFTKIGKRLEDLKKTSPDSEEYKKEVMEQLSSAAKLRGLYDKLGSHLYENNIAPPDVVDIIPAPEKKVTPEGSDSKNGEYAFYMEELAEYNKKLEKYKNELAEWQQDNNANEEEKNRKGAELAETYNQLKKDYDWLIEFYKKLTSRGKDAEYGELSEEELKEHLGHLEEKGVENLSEEEKHIYERLKKELERREKNKEIDEPKEPEKPSMGRGPQEEEQIIVTFKNGEFAIDGYSNIVVEPGQTIHGPVIDPVPLNKKGKPKITAKVFDCWVDENNNVVDLTKPIERSTVLTARYKVDMKKIGAVAGGIAVGGVTFFLDTFVIPVPGIAVTSTVGAAAFGIASGAHRRRLTNLTTDVREAARGISATEEIPEDLKKKIEEMKKAGNLQTFLKTAHISCGVAAIASGVGKQIRANAQSLQPNPNPTPQPTQPISKPVSKQQTTEVLGRYNPNNGGKVYRTARDAMNGTNGLNPYKPSYAGEQTFEAYNNLTGTRVPVQQGQSIDSIVQAVGASDPSQVSMNIMNGNGDYLAWKPISEITEQVVQVAPKTR